MRTAPVSADEAVEWATLEQEFTKRYADASDEKIA
jgi:hypothetical protein